jgi:glycosyltransferase involved in cell wall biosynthesis
MRILLLYNYPPNPAGLATQGELLHRGLLELGVEVQAAHLESAHEKEWYYRWYRPDVVLGIGFWGHTPEIVLHPQEAGLRAVPWLVADGFIANHQSVLNDLPLILVTSTWVKEIYARDGIRPDNIEVLPVGCDTDAFCPRDRSDPRVMAAREAVGVAADELLILTVGGDAASKGAQEVMRALALIKDELPPWRYVCKVWPQARTVHQNSEDRALAKELGIDDRVHHATSIMSRNCMPYLLAACDVYAAPSRLEGFGMPQVEANACGIPVLAMNAMAFKDTLVHGETALLADVAHEVRIGEAIVEDESEPLGMRRIRFPALRTVEYRASVHDTAEHLLRLLKDRALRERLGATGRERVVANFDYRAVARRCLQILADKLALG